MEKWQCRLGSQGRLGIKLLEVRGKEEKEKGTGKSGTYWSDEFLRRMFRNTEEGVASSIFTSFDALDEIDSDEEISMMSYEDFPSMSLEQRARRRWCPSVEKIQEKDRNS